MTGTSLIVSHFVCQKNSKSDAAEIDPLTHFAVNSLIFNYFLRNTRFEQLKTTLVSRMFLSPTYISYRYKSTAITLRRKERLYELCSRSNYDVKIIFISDNLEASRGVARSISEHYVLFFCLIQLQRKLCPYDYLDKLKLFKLRVVFS